MKIICLKLTTGEDLIARCSNLDVSMLVEGDGRMNPDIFELEDVHVINLHQVAPNQIGMALIPYLLGDQKAKIKISAAHVITTYPPNRDIEEGFMQKTSNIQIARGNVPTTRMQLS